MRARGSSGWAGRGTTYDYGLAAQPLKATTPETRDPGAPRPNWPFPDRMPRPWPGSQEQTMVAQLGAMRSRCSPIRHTRYDYPRCRDYLRQRGIGCRIARRGIESSDKLGRFRWVVERTFAWFNRFRRLSIRYERLADLYLAFLDL